ncbi:hypothetical protein O3G_MSEX003244 [Manduca sexta]|uniref:Alpha-1,6-mannosyl-glycoprotein 2-beta-N-acetylglucosaminyltransferase n=1 Tax=Manduca sexta TaxID=7130 RepID=A0A921YRM7_MANSE|nr:hypothetical protein O3G_MSEX003244 [Manduca sexta]
MRTIYYRAQRNIRLNGRKLNRILIRLRNILFVIVVVFILFIYKVNQSHETAVMAYISKSAHKFISCEREETSKPYNTNVLELLINKYNSAENIINLDVYGDINRQTIILVILVDKYSTSLKYFLASLSQIKGIEEAFLIFSHSYFDEDVNNLIRKVDFCRVLQIYYPHSLQLHSHKFPGYDPSDCPPDIDMQTAESLNCTGAWSPDIHGHYRNPQFAAKKHHWWWTANKVFENLKCTVNHNGLVVFLEHDFYFMEDLLYMTIYMKNIADTVSHCEFISLGTNSLKNLNFINTYRVEVMTWNHKEHSSVLGFDIKVWNSIVSHYDLFCLIDDYSWARSLYFISLSRRDGKRFKVLHSLTPRAFKIDATAFTNTLNNIEVIENVYQVILLEKQHLDDWFPTHIEVYYKIELEKDEYMIFEYSENNGGWNDPRDKAMCTNMTIRKIKKVLMDMKNEFMDYISEKDP